MKSKLPHPRALKLQIVLSALREIAASTSSDPTEIRAIALEALKKTYGSNTGFRKNRDAGAKKFNLKNSQNQRDKSKKKNMSAADARARNQALIELNENNLSSLDSHHSRGATGQTRKTGSHRSQS